MNAAAAAGRPPRRRVAIGPRGRQSLAGRESDRLSTMLTALVAAASASRDRRASHDELAAAGLVAASRAVEAYRPDAGAAAARRVGRTALLKRVYRVVTEELDAVDEVGVHGTAPPSATRAWDAA